MRNEFLVCRDCGVTIGEKPKKQGRYRTLCDACVAVHKKAHADRYANSDKGRARLAEYRKSFICKRCGAEFLAQSYRAHCSEKCVLEYEESKVRKATCRKCGIEFRPRSSRYVQYCSRGCAFADISAWRHTGPRGGDSALRSKIGFGKCLVCGKDYTRTSKTQRTCIECAGSLAEHNAKRGTRANKVHVTRAKRAGVAFEHFNQFQVFERDGWKCKICGVSTPVEKRGTYDDDAPELDHIIPLSKDGTHTVNNSQCACRKCNRHKSDSL